MQNIFLIDTPIFLSNYKRQKSFIEKLLQFYETRSVKCIEQAHSYPYCIDTCSKIQNEKSMATPTPKKKIMFLKHNAKN